MIVSSSGPVVAAATAVVIGLGALGAPAALADPGPAPTSTGTPGSPVVTGWAPASRAAVHPGVVTVTDGGGNCTANFVFTRGGRVLLGQAAHCAGTGDATETDGCTSATEPVGTRVTIRGSDGRDRTGTMVYSSWVTMQEDGERDTAACLYNDFALVELAAADSGDVNPSVPFFGGPKALHEGDVPTGTAVLTYGNSAARRGVATLRPRAGTIAGPVGGGFGHDIDTATPGVPGDSGSGYLTTRGEAVGLLSTLNLEPLPVTNGTTDLARALGYAADHGFDGVELEPGTEPFTPNPAALRTGRVPRH